VSEIRETIEALLAEGLTLNDVARRLRLAQPTVAYHARRIEGARSRPSDGVVDASGGADAVTRVRTREQVARLRREGVGPAEIARTLGITKSTVTYHLRRLGEPIDERAARRYDWASIQAYYDAGHSVTECQERFGFARASWNGAVKRGAVVPRPHAMPVDRLFVAGTYRSRFNLKRRLLMSGLKPHRCERCGLEDWFDAPISLCLHHVNGDRDDNRLENLALLCPNCHSQTDNFAGRNRRARVEPPDPAALEAA
jgi:DNA-binding CsgD family transcriptional regulator